MLFITFKQDVQERELSLIREYEERLLALEEQNAARDLATSTTVSEAIARLSYIMRQVLHHESGEDTDPVDAVAAAEYAMEREIELARLEKENEELRRMLGVLPLVPKEEPQPHQDSRPFFEPIRLQRTVSQIPAVGPYGTYKRARPAG